LQIDGHLEKASLLPFFFIQRLSEEFSTDSQVFSSLPSISVLDSSAQLAVVLEQWG
jgi:hypothetical protein